MNIYDYLKLTVQSFSSDLIILGPPGVGKSSVFASLCKELGIRHCLFNISHYKSDFFGGLVYDGSTLSTLVDLPPEVKEAFIIDEERIIQIDEFTNLNRAEKSALLSLLTERKILKYSIRNALFVLSGNDEVDSSLSTGIEEPFLSRGELIRLSKQDAEELFVHYLNSLEDSVEKSLMLFLVSSLSPKIVWGENNNSIQCNPRALTNTISSIVKKVSICGDKIEDIVYLTTKYRGYVFLHKHILEFFRNKREFSQLSESEQIRYIENCSDLSKLLELENFLDSLSETVKLRFAIKLSTLVKGDIRMIKKIMERKRISEMLVRFGNMV